MEIYRSFEHRQFASWKLTRTLSLYILLHERAGVSRGHPLHFSVVLMSVAMVFEGLLKVEAAAHSRKGNGS